MESTHYTVLARRFRPQAFADVVGQENVAQALRNAIRHDRVAHAYLFTGARGVGKTSMARILAKALNCPRVNDAIPCNECETCTAITAGRDVDVLEIDGASNRNIDDIRALRANVTVKSMRSRNKIYIIDEVHMLTRDSFNALLKTLEEPPGNVVFVFCTTEPNKLPDTILSRCQRFDFSTIETDSISERLSQIAEQEGVTVDAAAVQLVARRANGSMRDSQSLFDQLLAFADEHVTAADAHRLFGTADDERLIAIAAKLVERDPAGTLAVSDVTIKSGVQLTELTDQLLQYFRDLMVLATGASQVALLSVADEKRALLQSQADQFGLQTILAALEILAECKSQLFRASAPRALLEMALVRISLLQDLTSLSALISQMKAGQLTVGTATELRAVPAVGGNSPSQARITKKGVTDPTEKKTRDSVNQTDREASERVTASKSPETIKFAAGNESEILAQLIDAVDDKLKNHLKVISRSAISGPKQLALFYFKKYHFSKQYCEQAAVKAQLEAELARITATPVKLEFQLAADQEEQVTEQLQKQHQVRKTETDDPYVLNARSIFGGSIVKCTEEKDSVSREDN